MENKPKPRTWADRRVKENKPLPRRVDTKQGNDARVNKEVKKLLTKPE